MNDLTQCNIDTTIIGVLATDAEQRGLTEQEFKDKFDLFGKLCKEYLNLILLPDIKAKVNVDVTALTNLINGVAGDLNTHKADVSWVAPTLLNSWVNFGGAYATAGYLKDAHGFVHLKGAIKGGTTTYGTVLFTLPSGYRPAKNESYIVNINDGGNVGLIEVQANGNVIVTYGTNSFLSLSGITFKAI